METYMPRFEADTLEEAIRKAVRGEDYELKTGKPFGKPGATSSRNKMTRVISDCTTGGRCYRTLDPAIRAAAASVRNVERNSGRGDAHHGTIVYQDVLRSFTWQLPNDQIGSLSGAHYANGYSSGLAYVRGQGYWRQSFDAYRMLENREPSSDFIRAISVIAGRIGNSAFKGYWVAHSTSHAPNRVDLLSATIFEVSAGGSVREWR